MGRTAVGGEVVGWRAGDAGVPVGRVGRAMGDVLLRAGVESVDIVAGGADATEVLVELVGRAVGEILCGAEGVGRVEARFADDALVGVGEEVETVGDVLGGALVGGVGVVAGSASLADGGVGGTTAAVADARAGSEYGCEKQDGRDQEDESHYKSNRRIRGLFKG